MAKKARTPAPPRPVQAPQRRDGKPKRVPPVGGGQQRPWLLYGLAALGPIALVIVLGVIFLNSGNSSSTTVTGSAPTGIDYAALPGLQKGKAPWPPEYGSLPDRLAPLQLSSLGQQGTKLHVHQHLDIFVNGKHVTVPALIGIYAGGDPSQGGFFVELHTHDSSGIMHVESPKVQPFTLGQFFGVWGVRLSSRCVGGYCASATKPLRFFVNGKRFLGNPNNIVLRNHQEFAIVYGKAPTKIPKSYNWGPSGL